MRTLTIERVVYNHDDLVKPENRVILQRVHTRYDYDCSYIYDDAYDSIKAFINKSAIGIRTYNSFLDVDLSNVEDSLLELRGLRLRKWLLNNFGFLWKGKYIGSLSTDAYVKHNRIASPIEVNKIGKRFNPYYSGCQSSADCVLTGVCYDDVLLGPIYEFIERPGDSSMEGLLRACFEKLREDLKLEEEYRSSEENILNDIAEMSYEFYEDGERV